MQAGFPAMPLYWKDWLTGESILPMTPEQECAFFRLLLHAWGSSQPCTLPDDERALAQMAKQPLARWRKIRGPVMDQFVMVDGRLRNPKQWSVYVDAIAHRERRAAAGSKGGNARAMLQQSPSKDVAKPCPSVAVAVASSETDKENPLVVPPAGGKPKRERKRAGTTLPADWAPTEQHQTLASGLGLNFDIEVEKFRDHHSAKATVFSDWDAGFRNWLRKAREFLGNKPPAGSEASKYHNEYPGRGRNGSSGPSSVGDLVAIGTLSPNGERRWSGSRWEQV